MKEEIKDIELELSKFPSSVLDEFKTAVINISSILDEPYFSSWARQGVQIAQKTVRSWEAAAEYYKASSDVSKFISGSGFFLLKIFFMFLIIKKGSNKIFFKSYIFRSRLNIKSMIVNKTKQ